MVDGAVVGTVVDGFGEVEVGVGPVVVEGTDVECRRIQRQFQ